MVFIEHHNMHNVSKSSWIYGEELLHHSHSVAEETETRWHYIIIVQGHKTKKYQIHDSTSWPFSLSLFLSLYDISLVQKSLMFQKKYTFT